MTYIIAAKAAASADALSKDRKGPGKWDFCAQLASAVEFFDASHNIKEGFRDIKEGFRDVAIM